MNYIIEGKTGRWEIVVGLEVHCHLKTKTKLFSRSSTEFGKEQNTNVSFYDCAMPGQLPAINEYAVRQAVKTGIGLNAEFNLKSSFDRKNYLRRSNHEVQMRTAFSRRNRNRPDRL